MGTQQLGQREVGAARLEVLQRDVEGRDRLGGDAAAPTEAPAHISDS